MAVPDVRKAIPDFVLKEIISLGKDISDKYKVDMRTAFTDYLHDAFDRYSWSKTILYKDSPRRIYDFYVHNFLSYGRDDKIVSAKEVRDVFQAAQSNFLIISGSGGMGKSMMMKHFFVDAIRTKKRDEPIGIPIYVELRTLEANQPLLELIYTSVSKFGFCLSQEAFEYALRKGLFLLLLDAFDEIPESQSSKALQKINDFCDKYHKNKFVLSSRPSEGFAAWERFTVLEMQPLSKEQAMSLVRKLEYDEELKERFLQRLDEDLYESHEDFASNPLLLNIMLQTFDNYATIPEKLHEFYAAAFNTLYSTHDSKIKGYKRILHCEGLSSTTFRSILAEFCYRSYAKEQTRFTETDLRDFLELPCQKAKVDVDDYIQDLMSSVCILIQEGLDYSFSHRSFQEYFTAVYFMKKDDAWQKKAAKILLKNNPYSLFFDKMFFMLFDMNKEGFEGNIILPFLEECVKKIEKSDLPPTLALMKLRGVALTYGEIYNGLRTEKKFSITHSFDISYYDFPDFLQFMYAEIPSFGYWKTDSSIRDHFITTYSGKENKIDRDFEIFLSLSDIQNDKRLYDFLTDKSAEPYKHYLALKKLRDDIKARQQEDIDELDELNDDYELDDD
ncbi:MAG: NACHT domain-containing protein [Oscillospiraceae bacterium]|jgi:hypothetical protein|nr:NACHT domain-containing protein [Oscillospiraceae bacterium]